MSADEVEPYVEFLRPEDLVIAQAVGDPDSILATSALLRQVTEERDEARARAERFSGYWRECSRHRDQLAAEHAEAVAAHETTLLSVRAALGEALLARDQARADADRLRSRLGMTEVELAKARLVLRAVADDLCATGPGTDPLSATTDSPPIPAGDRKDNK